jgi:hypothetical protein
MPWWRPVRERESASTRDECKLRMITSMLVHHYQRTGVFLIEGMCEMAGETFLTTLTTMARTSMHCHSTIVHREIITPRTTCSVPQFGPASILPLIASPTHPLPLV